jgi:hypothetical protein
MDIKDTYADFLVDNFINNKLQNGEISDVQSLDTDIDTFLLTLNSTKPNFLASNYQVVSGESSSATKLNNLQQEVQRDLSLLYKQLITQSSSSSLVYERWKIEVQKLENLLINLETRISNLLLLSRNDENYSNIFIENFINNQYIDLDQTFAFFNANDQTVTLNRDSFTTLTKIPLDNIDPDKDISFKLRTSTGFLNSTSTGRLIDIVKQTSSFWFSQVQMGNTGPVVAELTIKLSDDLISLNKITLSLNDPNRGVLNITPLYSLDNYNFSQLPTVNYTQDVQSATNFTFDTIQTKYIKFLLTKPSPDPSTSKKTFTYQFGFKNLSFYNNTYSTETDQILISKPLSIIDIVTNQIVPFNRVTLETCERLDARTNINYFVTASNSETFTIDINTVWTPISPINRSNGSDPNIINFADLNEVSINAGISYDSSGDEDFISPAETFHLLSNSGTTVPYDQIITALDSRYILPSNSEVILNYQIKDTSYTGSGTGTAIDFDRNNLSIFRNVGQKGLLSSTLTNQTRGALLGWSFADPYYSCLIFINNANGLTINFGSEPVIIDNQQYTGIVGPSVLSGISDIFNGIHSIKIHKNNWAEVIPSLNTLTDLQNNDPLYPYNHKLLIEGYLYGTSYPTNSPKIYTGVDNFFEILMKPVNIFDLFHNINQDTKDYLKYYSFDQDVTNTHTGTNSPTQLFVVKINDNIADFPNEKFVIRFNLINQKYSYLRLKADLQTIDTAKTPVLSSYKIKFL